MSCCYAVSMAATFGVLWIIFAITNPSLICLRRSSSKPRDSNKSQSTSKRKLKNVFSDSLVSVHPLICIHRWILAWSFYVRNLCEYNLWTSYLSILHQGIKLNLDIFNCAFGPRERTWSGAIILTVFWICKKSPKTLLALVPLRWVPRGLINRLIHENDLDRSAPPP